MLYRHFKPRTLQNQETDTGVKCPKDAEVTALFSMGCDNCWKLLKSTRNYQKLRKMSNGCLYRSDSAVYFNWKLVQMQRV